MINRLQLLRNVGLFDSVTEAANLPLARLTLIYAENGRGKTTLAAILRSLATGDPIPIVERRRLAAQHPPHVVLDCDGSPPAATFQNNAWNRSVPNITVFDDVFVDQNVYSGLAVESEHRQNLHELILGAQGVILARSSQTLADRISTHNVALRTKGAAIPPTERGTLSIDDFCALADRADIDTAIQAAERNLAAVREQAPIREASLFNSISLPTFDAARIDAVLSRDLSALDADAVARVHAHLESLGPGGETWVAEGMGRADAISSAGATPPCPFCAQDLRGSPVMNHYRSYFSTAYADLKRAVADLLVAMNESHRGDVPAAFERAVRVTVETRQFWSQFCDVPEVAVDTAGIAHSWQTAHGAVFAVLQAKLAAPLEQMFLADPDRAAIAAFELHRSEIDRLSQSLQQANVAIRVAKEQAAAGNITAVEGELVRLRTVKARHTPTMAALCDAYMQESAAKAATQIQHRQARAALDQHRDRVFPAYQTAINEYLRRFNAGFRLDKVASANPQGRPSCTYCLVIDNAEVSVGGGRPVAGAPSFKNTLSAGDRNTLALAFFFASLDLDPDLADKIVIIDDPMTSLDDHRELATVQEVRSLSARAQQFIVMSHDKRFLCRFWEYADRQACTALAVVRDANGSTIAAWSVSDDCVTDYDRQHEHLRKYLRSNTGNSREVAQDIRHILEGFLRRACPEYFLPGEVLGDFRRRIRGRDASDPDILPANAVTELDAISEYANRFHHNTNDAWETETINDTELRGWVQRALDFVKK